MARVFLMRKTFPCNMYVLSRPIDEETWNEEFRFSKRSENRIYFREKENTEYSLLAEDRYTNERSRVPILIGSGLKEKFTFDDLMFVEGVQTFVDVMAVGSDLVAECKFVRRNMVRIVNLSATKDVQIIRTGEYDYGYACTVGIPDDIIVKAILRDGRRIPNSIQYPFDEGDTKLSVYIIDGERRERITHFCTENEDIVHRESGVYTYDDVCDGRNVQLNINRNRNGTYFLQRIPL